MSADEPKIKVLEHGITRRGGNGELQHCPECGGAPRYSDGRVAFAVARSGEGYAILRCEVCQCCWVQGSTEAAQKKHHADVDSSRCDNGEFLWPYEAAEYKQWWGEDV